MSEPLVSIVAPLLLDAMCDLARATPLGSFVEVGVYKGGSAQRLYEIAVEQKRVIHLFDTFDGMPLSGDFDRHLVGEFADCDLDSQRAAMPGAQFWVGTFPETLTDSVGSIAFVHCDCDQYESYRAVLDLLWPRMVSGGIILFDDYPYLEGAKRAVEEKFYSNALHRTRANRYFVVKP